MLTLFRVFTFQVFLIRASLAGHVSYRNICCFLAGLMALTRESLLRAVLAELKVSPGQVCRHETETPQVRSLPVIFSQDLGQEEEKARRAQRHEKGELERLESEHTALPDAAHYTNEHPHATEEDEGLHSDYLVHEELLRQTTKRVKEFSERRSAPLSRFVSNAHLMTDDDWGVITRFFAYKGMRGIESNESKVLSLHDRAAVAEELFELLVGRLG
jgi:hypothetical protein